MVPRPVIRLIGATTVVRDATEYPVARPRQRALLAALALRPGRVVRFAELIEGIWGWDAPASALGNLQTYASGLRTVLEPGAGRGRATVLVGDGDGYRLDVPAENVDALVFASRADEGLRAIADGRPDDGLAALDSALRLWGGEPLAGTRGPWCAAERGRLLDLRVRVGQARAAALLRSGRATEAVVDCVKLVRENPLREPLVVLLAEALAQSGRIAEALDELTALRGRLRTELNTEPARQTTELYQKLVSGWAADRVVPARATVPPPAQLPRRFWAFAGRAAEMARLSEVVRRGVPVVLTGPSGIGKTELAVALAHEIQAGFPDGTLYLDVGAANPAGALSLDDVLVTQLRALGVRDDGLPAGQTGRIRLYQRLLAELRLLVVLDDVAAGDLPTLLAGGGSVTIATTAGEPMVLHAEVVPVGPLDDEAAVDALAIGWAGYRPRRSAELIELAGLCRGIPLALRETAARLWSGERPADLLAELTRPARTPVMAQQPPYDRA